MTMLNYSEDKQKLIAVASKPPIHQPRKIRRSIKKPSEINKSVIPIRNWKVPILPTLQNLPKKRNLLDENTIYGVKSLNSWKNIVRETSNLNPLQIKHRLEKTQQYYEGERLKEYHLKNSFLNNIDKIEKEKKKKEEEKLLEYIKNDKRKRIIVDLTSLFKE